MSQIKVLTIGPDGVPLEHTGASDELTMVSFTLSSGAALSSTGLAMGDTDISGVQDLSFQDPSTSTVGQTAGALVVDNIMAKERENLMTTAGGISFPVITDDAGQVDSFRLPALAGVPSASPTTAGAGHLVYDSTNKNMYVFDGTSWDNLNIVSVAQNLDDSFTADGAIASRDVVYISAADKVAPADASAAGSSQAVGFATAAALDTATVNVRKSGRLSGFTGLTAGARYYLSETAGAVTPTIPTTSGSTIVQCGYAKNATNMEIQFQSLGRRA